MLVPGERDMLDFNRKKRMPKQKIIYRGEFSTSDSKMGTNEKRTVINSLINFSFPKKAVL